MAANGSLPVSLNGATLRKISDTVLGLNDPSLPEERLFDRLVAGCQVLIPHTTLWVLCSDLRQRVVTCSLGPWAQLAADLEPAFQRHARDNPLFMALCQGTAPQVGAVSDYVSRRQWRSTGIVDEVFKQIDATDQMATSRLLSDDLAFSLLVNRDGWGFSRRERSVLTLLTPHVIQAWRTHSLLKRIGSRASTVDGSPGGICFRVIADSWGNVIEAPEGALRWLRQAFRERQAGLSPRLPEAVRLWMREKLANVFSDDEAVLRCDLTLDLQTADGLPLHLRLATGPRYGVHVVTFERTTGLVEAGARQLMNLGLSYRKAEVLYWLAEGKTNDEIAGILSLSIHTVKNHLKSIFNLLMVENRHAAAAMAWRMLHRPPETP